MHTLNIYIFRFGLQGNVLKPVSAKKISLFGIFLRILTYFSHKSDFTSRNFFFLSLYLYICECTFHNLFFFSPNRGFKNVQM